MGGNSDCVSSCVVIARVQISVALSLDAVVAAGAVNQGMAILCKLALSDPAISGIDAYDKRITHVMQPDAVGNQRFFRHVFLQEGRYRVCI